MDSKKKALHLAELALARKAEEPIILDIRELSSVADYLTICSGTSDRQVQAIATSIEEGLANMGIKPLGVEGVSGGRWVLMDYADVIAHIFLEPVRLFYDLEGLWAEAPRVKVTDTLLDKD
ncbi:MAG: ribosome silencing factor [Deltaproteobacteria bacterium]|nr:ribosome silencing factor [Deltaproteobacteria bacterium]